MNEYHPKRAIQRSPVHPGEILREDVLPALNLSVSEAARRMGVSRQQLHRILACTHPITTEMALRTRKVCRKWPRLVASNAAGIRFMACGTTHGRRTLQDRTG
jgi:addiction module HigA family antidote